NNIVSIHFYGEDSEDLVSQATKLGLIYKRCDSRYTHTAMEYSGFLMDLTKNGCVTQLANSRKVYKTIQLQLTQEQTDNFIERWQLLQLIGERFKLDMEEDFLSWLFNGSSDTMMCTAIVPLLLKGFFDHDELFACCPSFLYQYITVGQGKNVYARIGFS
ncbi:MAG: hypothetical protein ACRDEA_20845, partial [Microcystaceae cyanobacterium]